MFALLLLLLLLALFQTAIVDFLFHFSLSLASTPLNGFMLYMYCVKFACNADVMRLSSPYAIRPSLFFILAFENSNNSQRMRRALYKFASTRFVYIQIPSTLVHSTTATPPPPPPTPALFTYSSSLSFHSTKYVLLARLLYTIQRIR